MATAPVKSPLHNFPPTFFKWGSKSPNPHRCRRNSSPSPPPPPNPMHDPKAAEPEPEPEVEGESEKPWKLRPRRTPTVSPAMTKMIASSQAATENFNLPKPMKDKRFWISLSKEEIDEDIYAITGAKPSRRPKKRHRNVQKQLDNVFPGLNLVGFSADTYRYLQVHSHK